MRGGGGGETPSWVCVCLGGPPLEKVFFPSPFPLFWLSGGFVLSGVGFLVLVGGGGFFVVGGWGGGGGGGGGGGQVHSCVCVNLDVVPLEM